MLHYMKTSSVNLTVKYLWKDHEQFLSVVDLWDDLLYLKNRGVHLKLEMITNDSVGHDDN